MRAPTDSGREVEYDRELKPGIASLLDLLAAATDGNPEDLAGVHEMYGSLKKDTADAVVELLRPLRERHGELAVDPGHVDQVPRDGAERARGTARPLVDRAYRAIGLLPAG